MRRVALIDGFSDNGQHRQPCQLPGWITPTLPYRHTPCMVACMKTTLNINDTVMRRLKEEAVRRRTTMSALVEAGLRQVLADPDAADTDSSPMSPLPTWKSGGQRVDISNREELYGAMEGE